MGEMRIGLQKRVYMLGEEVSGNVNIFLDKPVSQRSAMLYLIGKERTEVSYTTTTMAGKHATTTTHTAVEESGFLHQEFPIPLPIEEKGKFKPGNYSIPFRYILPEGLPTTYKGRNAKISYEIRAKIDVPLGSDINESTEFDVVSSPQPLMSRGIDVCSDAWNNQDSAGLNFTLERGEYGRGEVLSGNCAFRNPHSKNLRKINVALKWIETARAQGHVKTTEVAEHIAEVPIGGRMFKGESPLSIQIPQEAPLTFEASLCNVRCTLHVGLDIALGSDVAADQAIQVVGSVGYQKELPPYAAERPSYAAKSIPEKPFQPVYAGRPTTNIRCYNCGAAIETPDATYCPNCGSRLDTQAK